MANKIQIFRGTTYPFTYKHTDAAGAPVSLVGCTIYFTVKPVVSDDDQSDTSALIMKTITSHTDAAGGISDWTLTDVDTYIEPGKYKFDVIVEDASGHSDPPSLYGDFIVQGHPTNRQTLNG